MKIIFCGVVLIMVMATSIAIHFSPLSHEEVVRVETQLDSRWKQNPNVNCAMPWDANYDSSISDSLNCQPPSILLYNNSSRPCLKAKFKNVWRFQSMVRKSTRLDMIIALIGIFISSVLCNPNFLVYNASIRCIMHLRVDPDHATLSNF